MPTGMPIRRICREMSPLVSGLASLMDWAFVPAGRCPRQLKEFAIASHVRSRREEFAGEGARLDAHGGDIGPECFFQRSSQFGFVAGLDQPARCARLDHIRDAADAAADDRRAQQHRLHDHAPQSLPTARAKPGRERRRNTQPGPACETPPVKMDAFADAEPLGLLSQRAGIIGVLGVPDQVELRPRMIQRGEGIEQVMYALYAGSARPRRRYQASLRPGFAAASARNTSVSLKVMKRTWGKSGA